MTILCKTIPVYDVDVYLVTDREEGKAFIRERSTIKGEDTNLDDCRGVCYTVTDADGANHRLMCVFEGGAPIAVHEAVHMAWMVLKTCRVRVSQTNDEPLAYLTAYLATEMTSLIDGPVATSKE